MAVRQINVQQEYEARLSAMEGWYKDLVANRNRERLLLEDYGPHQAYLGSLRGRILDLGGGAGLAARFLKSDTIYVVVDPLELWKSPEWVAFGRDFRASGPEPDFVNARGEELPFPDENFDAALSLWSLNHVEDARRCVSEIIRVLKPGGRGRLVLEDTEPSWPDLLADGANRIWNRLRGNQYAARIPRPLIAALTMKSTGNWSVEPDHIPVRERDLLEWMGDQVKLLRRDWLGGYLTIDFERHCPPG